MQRSGRNRNVKSGGRKKERGRKIRGFENYNHSWREKELEQVGEGVWESTWLALM